MRKTLCKHCKNVWEESRDIPVKESQCPYCGQKVIEDDDKDNEEQDNNDEWIDPAGGVHYGNEENPASMYE